MIALFKAIKDFYDNFKYNMYIRYERYKVLKAFNKIMERKNTEYITEEDMERQRKALIDYTF